jgi:hypothetical protein
LPRKAPADGLLVGPLGVSDPGPRRPYAPAYAAWSCLLLLLLLLVAAVLMPKAALMRLMGSAAACW